MDCLCFPLDSWVRNLLRRADQTGHSVEQLNRPSNAVSGGGRTLGGGKVESSNVPNGEEVPVRHIVFWENGFQIEGGELRRYDDPEQARILAEINAGNAPPSVLNVRPGQLVELRVTKRVPENYVPSKGTKTSDAPLG